jgi:protein TonB
MKFFWCFVLLSLLSGFTLPNQESAKKDNKTEEQAPNVRRITVKGDVMKNKLVHKVTPLFPAAAMRQRISGTVVLHVLIGVDGNVKDIESVSGPQIFVKPTIESVRQYKYKPTVENGQPVEVDTTVETVFEVRQ